MEDDDPGGLRERKEFLINLQPKTVWEMTEPELVDYCFTRGIRGDKLEFVVYILIHEMKYLEISKHLRYSVDTLKDWSVICKKKLGISSWKDHRYDTHF